MSWPSSRRTTTAASRSTSGPAIPLELHGVVATKSGEVIDVVIGREKDEPQFVISDLLPHLAADQMKKSLAEGVTGEGLNILIGSAPYDDDGSDRVKLAVMSILNSSYGITEEDLRLRGALRGAGFRRARYRSRPQPNRRLRPRRQGRAYAELKAIFDVKDPEQT